MTAQKHMSLILLQLSSSFAIYNGQECNPEYYRFVVELIGYKNNKPSVKCSGTLITLNTVLTAAHCVQKFKRSIYSEPKVRLHTSRGNKIIGSKEIHVHENYNQVDLQYDIAVLILEEPFSPSEASTIDLPVYNKSKNTTRCARGILLGWGNTESSLLDKDGKSSKRFLQCIDLAIVSQDVCSLLRTLEKFDTYFCGFSGFDRAGGGCVGDSGGPFLCDSVQYGIASANFGCGTIGEPTYFTRIDKVLQFIERHTRSFASRRIEAKTIVIQDIFSVILLVYHL